MNIMMIAYYYPPMGGGGVQRTLKFVKYLSKMGHTVHILTVKKDDDSNNSSSDHSDAFSNVFIHRTDIKKINSLRRITNIKQNSPIESKIPVLQKKFWAEKYVRKLAKKIILDMYNMKYVPDDICGWIDYAVAEGRKIIKDNKIDIIYSTSSPYSAHLIGYELAKETNIKWIADFRDPWANNQFTNFNYVIKRKHAKLEAKVVRKADIIISVSEPIIDSYRGIYKNEKKDKFVVIPNGYDEEDFVNLNLDASKANERFMILYNGMIYGKRSPEKILKAIDNLIKKNKIPRDKIEIIFQGKIGNEHIATINNFIKIYPEVLKTIDQVPHSQSLELLEKANALLLIIDDGKGSEGIYTGKIFEYIRSGKVIIGIVPNGVARELIKNTRTGYTAYPSRNDEIERAIYSAYVDYKEEYKDFKPNFNEVTYYSRENLTKKLVEVMKL